VTNYFVVNLSIADLLVTIICMPVAVSQAVSVVWIHGELMCKLSSYLQGEYPLCWNPGTGSGEQGGTLKRTERSS